MTDAEPEWVRESGGNTKVLWTVAARVTHPLLWGETQVQGTTWRSGVRSPPWPMRDAE